MESDITQLWNNPVKRRYYRVQVMFDLFGDLCLVRSWGSLDTARGNSKVELLAGWQVGKRHRHVWSRSERNGYARAIRK